MMRGPFSPQVLPAAPPVLANDVLVSIVVPTYHEAENLPLLVPRITAALAPWPHEIIVVDDNSNDGTDQAVAILREQGHAIRLIVRTDQRGLSSAVLRGFVEAKGSVFVCIDADLSHPPEILPRMIEALAHDQIEFRRRPPIVVAAAQQAREPYDESRPEAPQTAESNRAEEVRGWRRLSRR
jgi:glycosyltransferase involved in cell wall biosynthesis